ncbi:efflux RND transporter periplasmic adaptor subunit [Pseudorhodoferax sp. Leaf265]|uniref:efflux RND transporter periplasmic adaptor subunit n=1 Tax=Pseudorhodoferax sp. Leaf265 TaxID=1736315 RepID=UPI0006F9AA38|nr:efflux RND transporter periplasmic adaptor subunit [Pseudorhodoferax sp. Leaf265]KQP02537.1 hemolysin secretion protein D [Pseudorhodoferax sp. Leaf265]
MQEPLPDAARVRKPAAWRALATVAVAAALVAAALAAWRASRPTPPAWSGGAPVDVAATTLQAEVAPRTLQALGELRAVRQVMLPAEVAGRVAAIRFEAGRTVQAGQLLVQLDDATEQADLAAAQAQEVFARQQLARAQALAATGALAQEVLQQRQAEHDQSAARVLQLLARIRQKRIEAPFAGELGLRRIDLGQYLQPGDAAASLTDLSSLQVNFDLPQQELAHVRVGQSLLLHSGASDTAPVRARVSAVEPQVGRDTRSATVQATMFPASAAQHRLRPGMYVTVALELPPEAGALLLPATAVMTSSSGDQALRVRTLSADGIGQAEFVPITLGRRIGERVVVAQGLAAGDVVVTEGQLRVQPGSALRVVAAASAQAAPAAHGGGQP